MKARLVPFESQLEGASFDAGLKKCVVDLHRSTTGGGGTNPTLNPGFGTQLVVIVEFEQNQGIPRKPLTSGGGLG